VKLILVTFADVASFIDITRRSSSDRKKLGAVAVEIFFGAKSIAAMQVTDVGEFHTLGRLLGP
jgi:hypothetical protein